MKRLLVVSSLFPNQKYPTKGIFNKQRVKNLFKYFDMKVISPLPWGLERTLPSKGMIDGIFVEYPRYFMIPKIERSLYGFFYGFSLFLWGTLPASFFKGRGVDMSCRAKIARRWPMRFIVR